MNDCQEPGKIILINGASSAGKSTLARSLQQKLPEPFLHWSFDHLRESNALPMARIRNGELDWTRMRSAVFDGFHRCLPAFAMAGNNLIVDHIIEQEQWLADLVQLLAPFDVFFVGVHCPLPELERRERHRGDRRIGEARTDFHAVHRFTEYDLDIDATQPNEDNVARLITAWQARSRPTAFERMATPRRGLSASKTLKHLLAFSARYAAPPGLTSGAARRRATAYVLGRAWVVLCGPRLSSGVEADGRT